jgi:hypothetical protein
MPFMVDGEEYDVKKMWRNLKRFKSKRMIAEQHEDECRELHPMGFVALSCLIFIVLQ